MVSSRTWRNFMKMNRRMSLALCLGVAFLVLTGNLFAVTARLNSTTTVPSTYAKELTLGSPSTITYKLVGVAVNGANFNSDVYIDMSVARTTAQNFLIKIALNGGATFKTGTLPVDGNLTLSAIGGAAPTGLNGSVVFTKVDGGLNGSTFVTYLSNITSTFTGFPTLKLSCGASGWTIADVGNQLNGSGISVTVTAYDAAGGYSSPIDTAGTSTVTIAQSANAVSVTSTLVPTTAVIDVATNRTNFVTTAPDSVTSDAGATIGVGYVAAASRPLMNDASDIFSLGTGDKVRLSFVASGSTPDFSGFYARTSNTGVAWGAYLSTNTDANLRKVDVAGPILPSGAQPITFSVDGVTALGTRTISISVDEILVGGGIDAAASTTKAATNSVLGSTTVTVWSFNGTILVAHWLNGNNSVYASRIYLWNSSAVSGLVTVRVFTEPLVGGGASTELTTPGTPLSLGSLAASSAVNIKLAEDILQPLITAGATWGPLPYTTNAGNLVVEVTIRATGARGAYQTFNNAGTATFGLCPLTVIQ
jgi:hypothetical protein